VRIWAFEGGKNAAGDAIRKWHMVVPTFHADAKTPSIEFTASDLEVLTAAIDSNGGKKLAQGFCEVLLEQPVVGDNDWSKDMDCTDPWMFPLGVRVGSRSSGVRSWHFLRPLQERGEVPDWKWLHHTHRAKYPEPGAVIKGK
jgi:hypothetical protein